jgi:hypothetical protein
MRKPLNNAELKSFARRLDIPLESLARWHREAPHFQSDNPGRPKGRRKRPKGTLSTADVIARYGIKRKILTEWRKQGIPHRFIGMMIVFNEKDIEHWKEKSQRVSP